MGWFSSPKCPHCGNKLTQTYYAFPLPQWRCKSCINRNSELQELKDRLAKLEGK